MPKNPSHSASKPVSPPPFQLKLCTVVVHATEHREAPHRSRIHDHGKCRRRVIGMPGVENAAVLPRCCGHDIYNGCVFQWQWVGLFPREKKGILGNPGTIIEVIYGCSCGPWIWPLWLWVQRSPTRRKRLETRTSAGSRQSSDLSLHPSWFPKLASSCFIKLEPLCRSSHVKLWTMIGNINVHFDSMQKASARTKIEFACLDREEGSAHQWSCSRNTSISQSISWRLDARHGNLTARQLCKQTGTEQIQLFVQSHLYQHCEAARNRHDDGRTQRINWSTAFSLW